jgi:hypothetical protein
MLIRFSAIAAPDFCNYLTWLLAGAWKRAG